MTEMIHHPHNVSHWLMALFLASLAFVAAAPLLVASRLIAALSFLGIDASHRIISRRRFCPDTTTNDENAP